MKRDRTSTITITKPAKIVKTADGREYIDLSSESEDGDLKEERNGSSKEVKKKEEQSRPSKDNKKREAEIEVVDLLN